VDAQPVGCGRMADYLVQASRKSGVNIIASTGFHKRMFYNENHWLFKKKTDELSRLFMDEILYGMYIDGDNEQPLLRIGARAGIIKTAVEGNGVDEKYKKLFTAAAEASIQTGAPIMCHLDNRKDAISVVHFLTSLRVPASNIILCHLDRAFYDPAFHIEIVRAGVYLEYDTIGRFKYHSDEKEIELLMGLIDSGYASQILLGLDTTNQRLSSYGGAIGLDYILNEFIDKMLKAGISSHSINSFTLDNPVKALSIKKR
jgi:phosphotriesterase-related protein